MNDAAAAAAADDDENDDSVYIIITEDDRKTGRHMQLIRNNKDNQTASKQENAHMMNGTITQLPIIQKAKAYDTDTAQTRLDRCQTSQPLHA